MKYIPKLFSTSMVQAIMEGNKTKTRRTDGLKSVNLPFIDGAFTGWQYDPTIAKLNKKGEIIPQECIGRYAEFDMGEWLTKCPYEVGDIIWVRETFTVLEPEHCEGMSDRFYYKANHHELNEEWRLECIQNGYSYKWRPGIHMPKSACRLFLKIKSVNVERLHDISEEDCIAEGLESKLVQSKVFEDFIGYRNYFRQDIECPEFFRSPYQSFQSLWMKINGFESWQLNPYVWVIEFEKINKPCNFIS